MYEELPPEIRSKIMAAREKYATRVCSYLGLPKERCYDEFDRLWRNMRLSVRLTGLTR